MVRHGRFRTVFSYFYELRMSLLPKSKPLFHAIKAYSHSI